jgi:predicted N-acetyltransferase YhbS
MAVQATDSQSVLMWTKPMAIRPLELKKDFTAVRRIWEEIGWIDRNDDDDAKFLRKFLKGSRTLAAQLNGAVECTICHCDGTILHQQAELSMAVIAAVTTSTVARKQGLASQLTARVVAREAESGLATAALGMFEQGYYSRPGFGTGPYERIVKLNPALIDVDVDFRPPLRLTQKHAADLYQALMQRWRGHGGTQVASVKHLEAEVGWTDEPLGLGYRDEEGKATHFIWGCCKGEYGPFHIATRLPTGGEVSAADDLIENLDRAFSLPTPATGWQF